MTSGYQDIIHLSGLVFIRRNFLEDILEKGLDAMLTEIGARGDLRADQKETFEACINDPQLQAVIKEWWQTYDEKRADGAIPIAAPWQPG